MNELNLQNPKFQNVIIFTEVENNQIIAALSPTLVLGNAGPLIFLLSSDSILSPIQTWKFSEPQFYNVRNGQFTTFDELMGKLNE